MRSSSLIGAEAIRKGIPADSLHPILPSSRHLPDPVIEADPDGYPRLEKPLAIIDCDLPEEVIQRRHPAFWRYLEQGKAPGIHSGYLASRRTPVVFAGEARNRSFPVHLYGQAGTQEIPSASSGTSRRRRRPTST